MQLIASGTPLSGKASGVVTATDKTDISAALTTLAAAGNAAPTFNDVRAALTAAKRARFTDGMIHQTLIESGALYEVLFDWPVVDTGA